MSEMETRLHLVEHVLHDYNARMNAHREGLEKLEEKHSTLVSKVNVLEGDVNNYTRNHSEAIRTLQETVQALRELTNELKQDSRIQEKSVNSLIEQMREMNSSIGSLSRTMYKFLYIGGGVFIAFSLLANGTLSNIILKLSGGG
jgi:chromosome segregation ATPase